MILDIIFAIILLLGFFHGYRKGIIQSVFSLAGLVFGILAAIKFSYILAAFLKTRLNISEQLLPAISFVLMLVLIIILFRIISFILEKIFQTLALNFFNKLAGAVLWSVIVIFLISTLLWFADQSGFVPETWKTSSSTFAYISPLAPIITDFIGDTIPYFKGLFDSLEELFSGNGNGTIEL